MEMVPIDDRDKDRAHQAVLHEGDQVRLVGLRCCDCRRVHFPVAEFCSNCRGEHFEPAPLGERGRLYSYSEIHVAPRQFEVPYIVGYVDFPADVRVFGQIDGRLEDLSPGMEMTVGWGPVRRADDGSMVETYRFRRAEARP